MATLRVLRPLLLLSLLGLPTTAVAAPLSWITLGNGSAAVMSNWSPPQVPAAADILTFNIAGPRTITWSSAVPASTLHVYRTGVNTLSFSSPHFASAGVVVGSQNGDNATANVTVGTLATGGTSTLGAVAGSTGNMTVSGANVLFQVQNAGADLVVGAAGGATLQVTGGGIVRVNDDLILGNAAGGSGTAAVSGASALNASTFETATADADIVVGNGGNGSLIVASGGVVTAEDDMAIAVGTPVNGEFTVGGTNSLVTVKDLCTVSNNATAGVGAGIGSMGVNTGGTMIVRNDLRVGDPDGGTGTLRMGGGFLHVKNLTVNAAHGVLDWDGGTMRVDGGTASSGSFVMGTSAGAANLQVIRGANFTITDELYFGSGGATGSILVDSGARLTVGAGQLIATSGTFVVTVDSSSTLGGGHLQLGGSSSNTSLTVSNGSYVSCSTFESADEGGAVSNIQLTGTGSHIDWDNVFYLAGDVGHAGGTATMTISNGGLLRGDGAASAIKIWNGGTMNVNLGGVVKTPGDMTILGFLGMGGGTDTVGTTTLVGTGQIRGRGVVSSKVVSSDATTRISAAGGDLALGKSAVGGFAFAGTLEASGFLMTLMSLDPITLGDTTTVDEGRIKSATALTNPPAGFLRAMGTLEAPTVTNMGVMALSGSDPDTLRVQGALNLPATSTLRVRIAGTIPSAVDRITVTSHAILNGTLQLFIDPHGVYPSAAAVTFLTFGTRTGSFSNVVVNGIDPSRVQIVYTPTSVQVLFTGTVAVEPGAELPRVLSFTGHGGDARVAGWFELALPRPAEIHLALYDVRGREVARLMDGAAPAGIHRVGLPASIRRGVYFGRVRVRSEDGVRTRTDRVLVL
jgi:T5SS/PEP-CTERM-associated repeat protein